jgi:hypothetical protein
LKKCVDLGAPVSFIFNDIRRRLLGTLCRAGKEEKRMQGRKEAGRQREFGETMFHFISRDGNRRWTVPQGLTPTNRGELDASLLDAGMRQD